MKRPGDATSILYWAILLAFFAAYLHVHRLAGLTFPVPWADEGTFLWQALAVARDNTLLAPQVNPDRHVMWMPPGYMLVQGLIFKLTGFSFAWARMLSALYVLGAMVAVASLFRRRRPALLCALLCGAFLMNRNFVLMGNIARADALMLMIVCWGFLLLQRGRLYPALSLLSLSVLVHPNGLYFCAGAGILFLITLLRTPSRARPGRADVGAVTGAALCWAAYATYAAFNWEGVTTDLGFAFTWKGEAGVATAAFWREWVRPAALLRWGLLAGALAYSLRRASVDASDGNGDRSDDGNGEIPSLLALAFALQLLDITTADWMYRIHTSLLHLVLSVLAVDMIARAYRSRAGRRGRLPDVIFAIALAVLALGVDYRVGEIENPIHYPEAMTFDLTSDAAPDPHSDSPPRPGFGTMTISDSPDYFEDGDLRALARFLGTIEDRESAAGSERVLRVSVFPWGESILLHELESEHVQLFQPSFYDATSDISIVHLSKHLPHHPPLLPKWKMQKHVKGWAVLHERDGTERWLYQDRSVTSAGRR